VGFGVARFDYLAMPELPGVGRVTSELPRFFICSHEKQKLIPLGSGGLFVLWQ